MRGDAGVRPLVGERERDRAAPGADVDDARRVDPAEQREGALDHDLGLRARHERASVGPERQPAEAPLAEHVGERLARGPALDELAHGAGVGLVERIGPPGRELEPREAERVRGDQLGVELRRVDARALEEPAALAQQLAERHSPSRRRRSSAVSASVNSSSAPCSTSSSRTVTFTRWSVTRSCGKL